jgi:KaiC/GvpD/RAD55 family RecA-like ATPase
MQKVLISFMISDAQAFSQSQNIIQADYFDSKLRPVVRSIIEYANDYQRLPTPEQLKAMSGGVEIEKFSDLHESHSKWYLENIEQFCRYKAMETVILDGPDLLAKGISAEIEKRFKEASTISLVRDLGTSYFEDPVTRLERIKDRSDFVSTGWNSLDDKLYGGFTKGALNVFAGGSGSGKSLFLQNLGLNWALAGMNVIYFSLELSEDLVAMRIDAMTSGMSTKSILGNVKAVGYAVRQKGKGAGDFRIKKMPEAGTTTNDLRAYVKEYEIQTGRKVDAIIVDYLDLMHPNSTKVDINSAFNKDKYVSEELRALAGESQTIFVTASQLNRQSVEAAEFDHSHIAGGISKINTADNVFGIFASPTMKEKGLYQLQFLKTRSSSAVGSKIDLAFDKDNLRISDLTAAQMQQMSPGSAPSQVANALKAGVTPGLGTSALGGIPVMTPVTVPEGGSTRQTMMDLMKRVRDDQ